MSKINRSELKDIIKECLVEILVEGLNPSIVESADKRISESRNSTKGKLKNSYKKDIAKRMALDKIKYNSNKPDNSRSRLNEKRSMNENVKNRLAEAANSMTDDPVLSSILKDTAMTTLQDQIVAEGKKNVTRPADSAAAVVQSKDVDDLFPGMSSKWAELAFASSGK